MPKVTKENRIEKGEGKKRPTLAARYGRSGSVVCNCRCPHGGRWIPSIVWPVVDKKIGESKSGQRWPDDEGKKTVYFVRTAEKTDRPYDQPKPPLPWY